MKHFKKLVLFGFLSSFLCNTAKADFDTYSIKTPQNNVGFEVYTCIESTGACTKKATAGISNWNAGTSYVDKENNLIIHGSLANGDSRWYKYDPYSDELSAIADWKDDYGISLEKHLIRMDSSGVTSIGENSLKLKETANEQQLWGTNSNGEIVPINITNGSKLLINGRDVEQSINNVGALSAALTGLPTVPQDTKLACGLGTGTHGGDYAFSGGCASKVNEKLSINYAASITMPGQDYAGDFEDKFSARAGFVWELGKIQKNSQISLKDKKIIDQKISNLEKDNKSLKDKNDEIISQNQKLLARLERLENIAERYQPKSELISGLRK